MSTSLEIASASKRKNTDYNYFKCSLKSYLNAYFNMQKKLLILVQMPPKTNSKYQLKIVLGICEVRTRILKKLMFFLF